MINRVWRAVALTATAAATVAGCGATTVGYDDHAYAAGICVGPDGYRVPNTFCPIGDGILNNGYGWNYYTYYDNTPSIVLPLVGYPVDRRVFVDRVPPRVSTLHLDKEAPERGAGATATIAPLPVRQRTPSSTITRGGLGVGATSSTTASPQKAAPPPKPTPPAPKSRPVAPARKAK